ncbi:MAG: MFS transporter [Methanomicrobia archaeon]|nr:MFS transporter [Methanomicrobia archaeon]
MDKDTIRDWFGLKHNVIVLFTVILVVGMGEELWIQFVPRYLEVLGASVLIIGVYGSLKELLGAIYQYPGGWLADRMGRRRALMLFALLSIVGYLTYLFASSWHWILIGTLFVMAWSGLISPAIFAIIGDNLPQNRRAISFGMQSILKRIPIVIAPLVGGWIMVRIGLISGVHFGLILTLFLAFLSIFIVRRYYTEKTQPYEKKSFGDIWRTMSPELKKLLLADCLARWAAGIPKVFIVLYIIDTLKGSEFQFGQLIAVRMLTSILVYIPIAKLADRTNRKPFVLLTFTFFALFPLSLAVAPSLIWFFPVFIIAGLREIGEPARKAMIVDLSSPLYRGRAVGTYYLIRGLVVFPASLIGGLLWTIAPQTTFYAAFLIGVTGVIVFALWGPSLVPESESV